MVRPEGFVLAGGASVRMGSDKASVLLPDGRRLGIAVAEALDGVLDTVRLVRRSAAPEDWSPYDMVLDVDGPRHPLTGVATALAAATTERVLVAPCDLPGLTSDHVATLLREAGEGTAVAWDGERLHPLLSVWSRSDAARVLAIARDGGSVRAAVAQMVRVRLPPEALVNANRPEDVPRRA